MAHEIDRPALLRRAVVAGPSQTERGEMKGIESVEKTTASHLHPPGHTCPLFSRTMRPRDPGPAADALLHKRLPSYSGQRDPHNDDSTRH
ncbi:hypothetical protein ACIPSE_44595 [Streptomyces sp. NPDC090106]|uniref:hypothetical protein n=1 Tax=Streptomyces sp. NPDC090106 TaxID=3365946 RepID=UPI00380850E7